MKQLIYYYLIVKLFLKVVTGGYLFFSGTSGLPQEVFAVSLALVLIGIGVLVRHAAQKAGSKDLMVYFAADAIGTAFNLACASSSAVLSLKAMDMMVTGNLFDILVAVVVVVLAYRRMHTCVKVRGRSYTSNTNQITGKVR